MSPIPLRGDPAHERGMELALEQARVALARGEPPFGVAILAEDGSVLAAAHDRVQEMGDMSAHAEMLAIRAACAVAGPDLHGCVLYTTCEPCPMCYTAAWLARVPLLVYGTTMESVAERTGGAQRELRVTASTMNRLHSQPLSLLAGVREQECLALFAFKR